MVTESTYVIRGGYSKARKTNNRVLHLPFSRPSPSPPRRAPFIFLFTAAVSGSEHSRTAWRTAGVTRKSRLSNDVVEFAMKLEKEAEKLSHARKCSRLLLRDVPLLIPFSKHPWYIQHQISIVTDMLKLSDNAKFHGSPGTATP